ncbi:MAG: preprotein translocase subunit SecE [Lactobacillaceae bacterium]|jgi:preprotein translocase subunit SecE|nr:preprotein translocase subunit SecE [Lactobacillaceae bacterium]
MKFFGEVVAEMRKTTWPTFSENARNTVIVLGTSLFFALFFGGADWIFEQGINFLSK